MIQSATKRIIVAITASWTLLASSTNAKVLITTAEARLPDDHRVERDPFPGPKIVLDMPSQTATTSPLHLKLRFEPRGAKIDTNSLIVTYKKLPSVDLTDRVKEFCGPSGLDIPNAELPPGSHRIKVEIKDGDGLGGHLEFVVNVTEQLRK